MSCPGRRTSLATNDRCGGQLAAPRSCRGPREPITVGDRELVHRLAPLPGRSPPVSSDVAQQRQPDQFAGSLITGEVPARLDDLAQPRMYALDGIGRVDDAAHRRGEREKRYHAIPDASPGRDYRRVLATPLVALEGVERLLGRLGAGDRVNREQRCRQQLAILPAGVVQVTCTGFSGN